MYKNSKFTAVISFLCLLNYQPCYAASKATESKLADVKIPKDGQLYYGDVPSYFSQPKYHDMAMGYSGNNIMGVNKTGKNILEWVYDEKFAAIGKIQEHVSKSCQDKGYSISAASNVKIELDKPLDNVYMILYSYEINCW
ncbi:hypothetical protein [Geomonas subterranea]|uniref:hypothetical protein n=1 Tax=Geomonas subterranea TaxID=2847989 RepID=UPI001CD2CCA7|nr:hypothetical protein [Geomonas fuzhouensis]